MTTINLESIEIKGSILDGYADILSLPALEFLNILHQKFNDRRINLLQTRKLRQQNLDAGYLPDFLKETEEIRNADWKVGAIPDDLLDRRVEITGPVERKMIINALNSDAKVFMADFEDSNTPTWTNCIQGQINLKDAVDRTISYIHPKTKKTYQLNDQSATLMIRPRGWHLDEKHLLIDGQAMSGALVDFGLFFFHNAQQLISNGSGPYFYLPKLESHLEARLWNDVFVFAQGYLNISVGTIKATVLIETILASFEMDEILYELRDHSAGLNCGRWDYIFSYIKKFRNLDGYVLPDRAKVGMSTPFMSAYSQLLIKTCHRRGIHAMGGMAAQIPIKNNPEANEKAIEKVRNDKILEVQNGHDGTWVAHPALVSTAMKIFDHYMPEANQIFNQRNDVKVTSADLLHNFEDIITEDGLRKNINVGILYVESWLRGQGAAAIYNLMEDAATAEISRSQIWQWIKSESCLDDGRLISIELYQSLKEDELAKIRLSIGEIAFDQGRFKEAIALFDDLVLALEFVEFLTIPAYNMI